jgi:hypothetical protein
MARISPITESELQPSVQAAFYRYVKEYNVPITNMKGTLAYSQLAFDIYMQWYLLYEQVENILGKRLAYLYAYSISKSSDCPLCAAFFRKLISDAGEKPESLQVTPLQKDVMDFGSSIAKFHGNIRDHLYNTIAERYDNTDMVILVAFAGQMIAANIFNNVVETDIDEYLTGYLPSLKYCWIG